MFGRSTVGIFALVSLAACQTGGSGVYSEAHWHTKVYRGIEGKVGEAKSLAHTSVTRLTDESTRASISLPGLLPRGEYAWGIFQGTCASPGPLMGSESDYPLISPNANSTGSFTALVHANFDPSADYQVTIYTTGGARDEVLGCNGLRTGTDPGTEE
jgi:hypothetical protein